MPRPAAPPVAVLRGATVATDARRVARALAVLGVVALLSAGAALAAAGVVGTGRQGRLYRSGVRVDARVTTCSADMGGTGGNLAGYRCQVVLSARGRRWLEALPGSAEHAPGATVAVWTVPADPSLLCVGRPTRPGALWPWLAAAAAFLTAGLLAAGLLAAGLPAAGLPAAGRTPRPRTPRRRAAPGPLPTTLEHDRAQAGAPATGPRGRDGGK